MTARIRIITLLGLTSATACASLGGASPESGNPEIWSARTVVPARATRACANCGSAIPMPPELTHAIETRLTELERRGGVCSHYAEVLERSYRSGRITLRPYMWRVGGRLVSGEARPNGEMMLAREIDSLNVGVRTVEDVLWSVEHEAVHIAFQLSSGSGPHEDRANGYVRACRADRPSDEDAGGA